MRNEDGPEIKASRSAEKRAARAVEDLAKQLVQMSDGEMESLPLEEDLKHEIGRVRKIRGRGAAKREIKHLAARLRRDPGETEKIRDFIENLQNGHLQKSEEFHRIEQLREGLCSPKTSEETLIELDSVLPPGEKSRLRKLVHSCLHFSDKKAYREIFRLLRRNIDSGA